MSPAAGWFPDPEDATALRYWDGQAWTEHRAPAQQPQVPPPYPAYPQAPVGGPYASGPYAPPPSESNTLSIIGIICGSVAFLLVPPLFGIAGLILGGVGKSRNERLAPWALGVSAAGLVIGMILGALVWSAQV